MKKSYLVQLSQRDAQLFEWLVYASGEKTRIAYFRRLLREAFDQHPDKAEFNAAKADPPGTQYLFIDMGGI